MNYFFQSIAQQVADFFKESKPEGLSPQGPMNHSLQRYIEQHHLASLLHYEAYDEAHHVYLNGTYVGAVLELSPCVGVTDAMLKQLQGFVNDVLPADAIMQVLLYGSPKIDGALNHWAAVRSQRGGFYQTMCEARVEHLKASAFQSLLKGQHYHLRDVRIIASLQLPGTSIATRQQVSEIALKLENTFSAMGSFATRLAPTSFLQFLRELVNPDLSTKPSDIRWDESRSLASQCVAFENDVRVEPSELLLNHRTWAMHTFSVEQLPQQWHHAHMTNLIGLDNKDFLQLTGVFCMNLVFRKISPEKAKKRVLLKSTRADQLSVSPMARFLPRAKFIAKDWQTMKEAMDIDGAGMVHVMLQAAVFAPIAQIEAADAALKAVFLNQGWQLAKDQHLCLQSFLCLLPMQVSHRLFQDRVHAYRTRTLSTHNIPHFMPLQGEWKGVGQPCLLLAGRRGQVCWFDPFANQSGNYNVAVTGKSRSGKSVLLQELAAGIVGSLGRAFIFDIGRSFEKSCKYFKGEFLEFHRESPVCLNPFTTIEDVNDSLEMLGLIYATMASQTRELTEVESAFLEEALKETWRAHGREGNATLVAQWLREHPDTRANDLGISLYPYTVDGQYGALFNGPCNLDFSNPYIVLELEELKSKKKLQTVVLMMLMYHVTEAMYHGGRKQRILCIIDEAWDLLSGKLGGQFIETGYRRAAKYNGAFVAGTQGLADFDKSPAARACKENADTLMIMSQKGDTLERAEKEDSLDMTPHLKELLKSVKTVHEAYAEVCIKTSEGYSVQRLLLDSFSSTLYSSKGPVHAEVTRLTNEEGYSMEEAVQQVAHHIERGDFQ